MRVTGVSHYSLFLPQLESETITGIYSKVITRSYETSGVIGRINGFNTGADYGMTYGEGSCQPLSLYFIDWRGKLVSVY